MAVQQPVQQPARFRGVCGCSPMFTKEVDLREPDTHTHVRTPKFRLGVKWSQVRSVVAASARSVMKPGFLGICWAPACSGYAAGTQQCLQQVSSINNINALTCMFLAQPTQLDATNAHVASFASSRSGVRFPLAPQHSPQAES